MARGGTRWKEALERKAIGCDSRDRQRRDGGRRSWHRAHDDPGVERGAHQPESGVGDRGSAGVGHERDFLAIAQMGHELRRALRLVMLEVREHRAANLMRREHRAGAARVLAGDAIGFGKNADRARRKILGISDRRGDDEQDSGSWRIRIHRVSDRIVRRRIATLQLLAIPDPRITMAAAKATLLIACIDRPGIIARVAGHLFELDCNIITSDQYSDDEDGHFFWRIHFESLKRPIGELANDLKASLPSAALVGATAMASA